MGPCSSGQVRICLCLPPLGRIAHTKHAASALRLQTALLFLQAAATAMPLAQNFGLMLVGVVGWVTALVQKRRQVERMALELFKLGMRDAGRLQELILKLRPRGGLDKQLFKRVGLSLSHSHSHSLPPTPIPRNDKKIEPNNGGKGVGSAGTIVCALLLFNGCLVGYVRSVALAKGRTHAHAASCIQAACCKTVATTALPPCMQMVKAACRAGMTIDANVGRIAGLVSWRAAVGGPLQRSLLI